jgi:hypothetical protein
LKRAHARQRASHKPRSAQPPVPIEPAGREIELSLDRDELLGLMQDSLESLALKLGMLVVSSLLEDEVTGCAGHAMSVGPTGPPPDTASNAVRGPARGREASLGSERRDPALPGL